MTKLPPLKSLEAFDAAARHLSFKRAAETLNLTPTAVSHRIRVLEEHLGRKLFHRLTRSLRLTAEGEAYAPWIRQGFQAFRSAEVALHDTVAAGDLVVTATMSFATNWLGPRLHRFSERHPDISVRLIATDDVLDTDRHGLDIAIRYGNGEYGDRHVAWVLTDVAVPVCNPGITDNPDRPLSVEEILEHPLIQYEWRGFRTGDPSWSEWCKALGYGPEHLAIASVFSDEHMCIQAAIDGHGIALVGLLAAAREIEAGRLIIAHPQHLRSKGCYLTCAPERIDLPKYAAFQDWLLEESETFRDSHVGSLMDTLP